MSGDVRYEGVRAMQMRGGTSKGLYLLADDLPADVAESHRLARLKAQFLYPLVQFLVRL